MDIIVGGGPAGFFGAITLKSLAPERDVLLLEKSADVLRKVKISGGGRCNVTTGQENLRTVAEGYPRGGKALLGALHHFGPAQTRAWFEDRGVPLKTEADGRVFPVSNSSASIIEALTGEAQRLGVRVETGTAVKSLNRHDAGFQVELSDGRLLPAQRALLATGGGGHRLAQALGHTVMDPVPSLFTFNSEAPLLEGLAGVAVPQAVVRATGPGLPRKGLEQSGPLLITHWGVSGPAVLRLSAWGARLLAECGYHFTVLVDWCPDLTREDLAARLGDWAGDNSRKQVSSSCPVDLPRRLWTALVGQAMIPAARTWGELGHKMTNRLVEALKSSPLPVQGKSTFKEEFVTCGGVDLREVDFSTMESRCVPGLFLAGEVLDIDGITGGYNFQSCWTTGFLAGQGLAKN
nr:NAD(P)/FAD-dependent oxidoreductase [Candidatus Krumholzibacteria bacterium]